MTAEDELRRAVEDATRAARAAQDAAERVAREQPSRFEQVIRVLTSLLTALSEGLFSRFDRALETAQRTGEAFTARVLRAVSRAARHLMRAATMLFVAGALLVVAVVVLTAGFVRLFNDILGEPWGTLLVGIGLLLMSLGATALAYGRLRAIVYEADEISPR